MVRGGTLKRIQISDDDDRRRNFKLQHGQHAVRLTSTGVVVPVPSSHGYYCYYSAVLQLHTLFIAPRVCTVAQDVPTEYPTVAREYLGLEQNQERVIYVYKIGPISAHRPNAGELSATVDTGNE